MPAPSGCVNAHDSFPHSQVITNPCFSPQHAPRKFCPFLFYFIFFFIRHSFTLWSHTHVHCNEWNVIVAAILQLDCGETRWGNVTLRSEDCRFVFQEQITGFLWLLTHRYCTLAHDSQWLKLRRLLERHFTAKSLNTSRLAPTLITHFTINSQAIVWECFFFHKKKKSLVIIQMLSSSLQFTLNYRFCLFHELVSISCLARWTSSVD